jgi:hypothetical protein
MVRSAAVVAIVARPFSQVRAVIAAATRDVVHRGKDGVAAPRHRPPDQPPEAGAQPRHQGNIAVDRVFSAHGNSHCIECCRRFVSRKKGYD